jgi:hypothetical protein
LLAELKSELNVAKSNETRTSIEVYMGFVTETLEALTSILNLNFEDLNNYHVRWLKISNKRD